MKFEKSATPFQIKAEDAKKIFVKGKAPNYGLIRDLFGNFINSNLKYSNAVVYAKTSSLTVSWIERCKKVFKLCCSTEKAFSGSDADIEFKVLCQTEDVCECGGKPGRSQIRGEARNTLKDKLSTQLPKQVMRQEALAGGQIPSQKQLEHMIAEKRAAADLDPNVSFDLMKRYIARDPSCIKEVSFYKFQDVSDRFRAILIWDDSVSLFKQYLEDRNRQPLKRVLMDSTGKIVAPLHKKKNGELRQVLHHVLLLPFPNDKEVRGKKTCHLIPVAEMITDDQTGENISKFLRAIWLRLDSKHQKKLM